MASERENEKEKLEKSPKKKKCFAFSNDEMQLSSNVFVSPNADKNFSNMPLYAIFFLYKRREAANTSLL